MKEKIKHSLQVLGAGNFILKHEPYFQTKSDSFVNKARIAILLHDVYRFREIRGLFETRERVDHSVYGAHFLKQIKDFDDILITLPIKHHGHMIERLYEDEEYQALDDQTKDEVQHISFAVRDADKIANWNLVTHEFEVMREVWLKFPNDYSKAQGKIDSNLWSYFLDDKILPGYKAQTNADGFISVICWLFDVNYTCSIDYSLKLHLFQKFCGVLEKLKVDQKQIDIVKDHIEKYLLKRFQKQIKIF